jgi:hypothetical protein
MPVYDGKVHISTGLYLGFMVSCMGGYSSFVGGTLGFLILTYYTHETFHIIVNSIGRTFYQRVIASSIDKIIEELASSGRNNSIAMGALFVIRCLKYCFMPALETTPEPLIRQEHANSSYTDYPTNRGRSQPPIKSVLDTYRHLSQETGDLLPLQTTSPTMSESLEHYALKNQGVSHIPRKPPILEFKQARLYPFSSHKFKVVLCYGHPYLNHITRRCDM